MVANRPYKPNNLSINPFQLGMEIAKPYDYDGTLEQIGKWNALGNAESVADLNEVRAQTEQQAFELDQKRREAVEAQVESGIDPLRIDYGEINRSIGDFEGVIKAEQMKAKGDQESRDRQLKTIKDLSTISKSNPDYATQLANEFGIGSFRVPVQKGSGEKPKETKPPKIEMWTDGKSVVDVDMNDAAAVNEVRKSGLLPLKALSVDERSQIQMFPEQKEEVVSLPQKQGFFSWLNGDKNTEITKGNRDTQASQSSPPLGYEYTGRVDAQGRKGIRKIQ